MSFGFSIGDFIAVGDLAWKLYRDCYKVARGAPQEFHMLEREVSTLSHSLKILLEEVNDPDSILVKAGEDRVRMVNEMVAGIGETLKRLEKVAKKYEILGSKSKSKQIWTKFKWSVDTASIDSLRNKLTYHNTVMNLLLTSVGNSSLQRIESSTAAVESDVKAIKGYIVNAKTYTEVRIPSLSLFDDDLDRTALSAALMSNAEIAQPWSTIGVEQWIEAGRWWLLRSQVELYNITLPEQDVPLSAYTNLIKASWILVDIIACHPQVSFLTASKHGNVQTLSAELKHQFARLSSMRSRLPGLDQLQGQDLKIWEASSKGYLPRPHKSSPSMNTWTVEGGEQVVFHRFAIFRSRSLEPTPCMVLLLAREQEKDARLTAQNQNGSTIMAVSCQRPGAYWLKDNIVSISDARFEFALPGDAQLLSCHIEAAHFYLTERKAQSFSLEDLKAFALLTAIKNNYEDAATWMLQVLTAGKEIRENAVEENIEAHAANVASALALQYSNGELNREAFSDYQNLVFELEGIRNKGSPQQAPLFYWAVCCGHDSLVRLLINDGVTITHEYWENSVSPLAIASLCGHKSVIRTFLHCDEHCYRIGQQANDYGCSTLVYAISNGYEELACILIQEGADFQAEDRIDCRSTLYYALSNGHEKLACILIQHGADFLAEKRSNLDDTPLHLAARKGYKSVVRSLIDKGADIEAKDFSDCTALMLAAHAGHVEVVMLLLEEEANALARDMNGRNVTHAALLCSMPNHVVERIYEKAHQQREDPQTSLLRIYRTHVTLESNSDYAKFILDSFNASIEMPEDTPSYIECRYGRMVKFKANADVGPNPLIWKIQFNILHVGPLVDFSIDLYLTERVKILLNGCKEITAKLEHGLFQSFSNVKCEDVI